MLLFVVRQWSNNCWYFAGNPNMGYGSAGVCRDVAPSLLSGDVPEAAVSSGEGKAVAWISSSPFFLHRMADQLSTSTLQPCFI